MSTAVCITTPLEHLGVGLVDSGPIAYRIAFSGMSAVTLGTGASILVWRLWKTIVQRAMIAVRCMSIQVVAPTVDRLSLGDDIIYVETLQT